MNEGLTPLFLWVIVPTTFIAGIIRGYSGFGGPIVVLSMLNFFLPPTTSIPIILCIDLLANIILLPDARHKALGAVTIPLTLGTLVSLPFGVLLLSTINPEIMKRLIALAILAAALLLLSGWRPFLRPIGITGWGSIGGLTGVIMGATSLGVTAALFLNSGTQTAAVARANFIVWVLFSDAMMLLMFGLFHGLSLKLLSTIGTMAPLYFVGSMVGARLHGSIPEKLTRRIILVLIAISGLAGMLL
jgi:uncharacterized membrane protein YfcA